MVFKIYSFFSGGGFLDLGFEESNFEIVLVNEYQKEFIEAYKYSREKMELGTPKYGYFNCDISDFLRKEKKETLTKFIDEDKADGNIIGFIGGPPCPDFSVAGKNKGIDGDNGKLTLAYKKLILQNCPDFFVLENVKGLWKTKKHRIEYEKLKQSFKRKGYVLIDNLVNSLEYGVPQSRERIFMIGIRSSLFKNQEALLEFKTKFTWGKNKTEDLNEILSKNWPLKNEFKENSDAECPNNIIKELTVKFWFDKNDVDFHPNAKDFFNPKSSKIQL
ncbi:DNA cytosine methyltransferase, partial [Escherichia coli]|uniref:DNA cytosine methyltransferase n=5 Tax=Bacteria TaxID=2 RepID=UPI003CEDDCF5